MTMNAFVHSTADYDVPVVTGASDEDLSNLKTTSAKIRYLAGKEMKRADIARKLNIRYQHVKNVLEQPLKRG